MAYIPFLPDMNVNSKGLWDKWLNLKWIVLLEMFLIMKENEIVLFSSTFYYSGYFIFGYKIICGYKFSRK
jgi:hypothetical protein